MHGACPGQPPAVHWHTEAPQNMTRGDRDGDRLALILALRGGGQASCEHRLHHDYVPSDGRRVLAGRAGRHRGRCR